MLISIIVIFSMGVIGLAGGWLAWRRQVVQPPRWQGAVALALVVAGIWLVIVMMASLQEAFARRDWPTASGRITQAEVSQTRDLSPQIRYEYAIDGRSFVGSSSVDFPGFGGRGNRLDVAEKLVAQYAAGKEIDVYYDPENPAISLLKPGPTWDLFGKAGLGAFFVAAGVFWLARFARAAASRRR